MSRIPTPATVEAAPGPAQVNLQAVHKQLGVVPNLFRLVANSPAALEGYLGMSGALAKGSLPAQTRERIALAVAQINDCGYCLSAHSYLGKNLAKLSDAEIAANRHGGSLDPKADAAVRFSAKVVRERGHVSDSDVQAVRLAGYDDAQIVEIVQHVALNTWTNYINAVAKTAIDFPQVEALAAWFTAITAGTAPPGACRPCGPRIEHQRPRDVPPTLSSFHTRDSNPKGSHGRGCLEWPRPCARGVGVFARQPLAQPGAVPARACRDRGISQAEVAARVGLPAHQGVMGLS